MSYSLFLVTINVRFYSSGETLDSHCGSHRKDDAPSMTSPRKSALSKNTIEDSLTWLLVLEFSDCWKAFVFSLSPAQSGLNPIQSGVWIYMFFIGIYVTPTPYKDITLGLPCESPLITYSSGIVYLLTMIFPVSLQSILINKKVVLMRWSHTGVTSCP